MSLLEIKEPAPRLLRPRRAARRRSCRGGGRHHRADRAQRRGQDDAVQRGLGAGAAGCRLDPLRRRRRSPAGRPMPSAGAGWCAPSRWRAAFPSSRCSSISCSMAATSRARACGRRSSARKAAREREAELAERAWETARFLQLDHLIDNPATALSGGQKKLLEIGRALMAEPRLVLLDEPTAGVNPTLQNEIGERLLELPRARHHRAADRARHGLHRPASAIR